MTTPLEALLESIDPSRTFEETLRRVDHALNTFPLNEAHVQRWEAFEKLMARFFRHVENAVLRVRADFGGDPIRDWDRCRGLLIGLYGRNGEKAAFEMARTGNEGGLYGLLKALGERMAEEYGENEVRARIAHYWNGLGTDGKLTAAEEYLEKWGHLLPSELTEGSAARVRMEFPEVLLSHVQLLMQTRRVGR